MCVGFERLVCFGFERLVCFGFERLVCLSVVNYFDVVIQIVCVYVICHFADWITLFFACSHSVSLKLEACRFAPLYGSMAERFGLK